MKEDTEITLNSFLTFKLDDEVYAINASNILHILEMVKISKVPKAPDYMIGVINLRDQVLGVIDMRKKFELPPVPFSVTSCILIVEIKTEDIDLQLGLAVDEVKEVIEISEKDIKDFPSIGNHFDADFLDGVAFLNDTFVMILNIQKILSLKEIKKLKKAAVPSEETETVK